MSLTLTILATTALLDEPEARRRRDKLAKEAKRGELNPPYLRNKTFAHIVGKIPAAPLDMARRWTDFLAALEAGGWHVIVRDVSTDFGRIPTPRDQLFEVLLWRSDRSFAPTEAQDAVASALAGLNMNYSAWGTWLVEVADEVVLPTVQTVKDSVTAGTPWLLVGVGIVAAIFIGSKLKD